MMKQEDTKDKVHHLCYGSSFINCVLPKRGQISIYLLPLGSRVMQVTAASP